MINVETFCNFFAGFDFLYAAYFASLSHAAIPQSVIALLTRNMGKDDKQVKKIMGVDSWETIMSEVRKGSLSAQNMNEIAALLHETVGGNHLRRMEKNRPCDCAEMRKILSDWYNETMFNYNSKRAVNELAGVLRSQTVNLPRIASAVEKHLKNAPRIVLLGETGSGKSSIGNCLLGLDPRAGFKESGGTKSCTLHTQEIVGTWFSSGKLCAIVDTPGMNDSDNADAEHLRDIVQFLREGQQHVDCFLLVRNGHNPRMSHSFKRMLSTFELTFGSQFWKHITINVSHVRHNHKRIEEQNSEWKSEINALCPESLKAPLRSIILDIDERESEDFISNATELWQLVVSMDKFACKDLEALAADLDGQKAETRRLQSQLKRALQKIQQFETTNKKQLTKAADSETEIRQVSKRKRSRDSPTKRVQEQFVSDVSDRLQQLIPASAKKSFNSAALPWHHIPSLIVTHVEPNLITEKVNPDQKGNLVVHRRSVEKGTQKPSLPPSQESSKNNSLEKSCT